jgi:hypothetical protein
MGVDGREIGLRESLRKTGTYSIVAEIRTVEVSDLSIVDNIATPFRVCSHGTRPVALVITTIDLFGR